MDPDEEAGIPVYRVMNSEGEMTEKSEDPKVTMTLRQLKKTSAMSFTKDESQIFIVINKNFIQFHHKNI